MVATFVSLRTSHERGVVLALAADPAAAAGAGADPEAVPGGAGADPDPTANPGASLAASLWTREKVEASRCPNLPAEAALDPDPWIKTMSRD